MARTASGDAVPSRSGTRQWATTGATRRAILDAARELFAEIGYKRTSIDDIVERSGVSVGSIYHHMGGKAGVFNEVAREVMAFQSSASHDAVAAARDAGVRDLAELYLTGARAYLKTAWEHRGVSRIMMGDDRPLGFADAHVALVGRMLAGMKDVVVGVPPVPEASNHAILALLSAATELALRTDDEEVADALADYYIGIIRLIVTPVG